jgi:hypothetical protein
MRETRQVTVTLLPVAVEFEAKPGDRLMILGDICIGVDTSHRKTAQPKLLPAPSAAFQSGKSRNDLPLTTEKMRDMILAKMQELGEVTSSEMTALLGLPQESRMAVTSRIGELIADNKIKVVSGTRAKRVLALP